MVFRCDLTIQRYCTESKLWCYDNHQVLEGSFKMRKKLYATILLIVILTSEIVIGKETNKTKIHKAKNNKKHNNLKDKTLDRLKRSLDQEEEDRFWANRGKKQLDEEYSNKYDDFEPKPKVIKDEFDLQKEPFWGTRGRRDSSSSENYFDDEYGNTNCKNCYGTLHRFDDNALKNRREDTVSPFWGNRGRRNSDEVDDSEPFWGNRGRRQDDDPFWGMRGRRKSWSGRGIQEDEPFWGNRGRRDDDEPFWGNRGRRQENEPFWGNRGRRDDEPFWGNRGRRKENDVFWGSRGRKKENLKESILEAIKDVENDIENLSRMRRSDKSFWSNRGRESKLNYLFNNPLRSRLAQQHFNRGIDLNLRSSAPGTVHDSRIYAEEPHYILVERSSRSSAEDDPYYISRGKKLYLKYNLVKAARDRRGAIEEIVKSVRNDPYYIARGKKDSDTNFTSSDEDLSKVKDLVCSAIDLIAPKTNGKVKREIDADRDRRTILKKLAAQLQIDPYYVSRGKKSDESYKDDNLKKFVNDIAEKCV